MNNPRNYPQSAIDAQLRFTKGSRKISFRYDLLDRNDIKIGDLDGISSAHVSQGTHRTIKRSATFTIDEYLRKNINFLSDQIQPWFVLHMPDEGTVDWPLGIFMSDSPALDISGKSAARSIGMCDKTLIIEQDKFTQRFFLRAGTNYIEALTRILEMAGITKINIESSPLALRSDREYPIGTKMHLVCNALLQEINFNSLWVDEMGFMRSESYIEPAHRTIDHIYDSNKNSIVMPRFSESLDLANRPNVFTRVAVNFEEAREMYATFENADISSPISTIARGRRIVDFEEISEIASQEALNNMVRRLAIESTTALTHLKFYSALMPTHGNADTMHCNFSEVLSAPAKFTETSWEMPLKFDALMEHNARKVVQI